MQVLLDGGTDPNIQILQTDLQLSAKQLWTNRKH
jgi:hypothetical protein